LISKVISLGVKGTNTNVYKIIWNKGINYNNETYLIHNSRLYQKPMYYYISTEQPKININWSTENARFIFSDSELNESIEFTVNEIIQIIDVEYKEHFSKDLVELNKLPVYQFLGTDLKNFQLYNYHLINQHLVNERYLHSGEPLAFKFPINLGAEPLQIVSPFK
ncbi:MAG: hypothetical protein ACYC25_04215, partial [Paludibacter sp.]